MRDKDIIMYVFTNNALSDPKRCKGVCGCGQEIEPNERIMLYPVEDVHEIVCLTCHFWNVHNGIIA